MFEECMSVEERLTRAKVQLYDKSPLFAWLVMKLRFKKVRKEVMRVPTMGVDRYGTIYYVEEFVESLNTAELMGVLAHETSHVIFNHLIRGEGKNQEWFNVANDVVVNDLLLSEGFTLPKTGILPSSHEVTLQNGTVIKNICEKSSEEIYYEIIKEQPKKDGEGSGEENEGFDNHIYGKDPKKEAQLKKERNGVSNEEFWKRTISEAATVAQRQGKLPAGMARLVEGLLDSKVNWKHVLYKYICNQLIHDYSWSRPSKRGIATNTYLPTPIKEDVEIIFHIDTSGSMNEESLSQALTELVSIMNSFSNVQINVLMGDAELQNQFVLTNENSDDILDIAKEMKGGGGTDHTYVFDHVENNFETARLLICFSDGYTSFPDREDYFFNTLWVISKDGTPSTNIPFGEKIRIENGS